MHEFKLIKKYFSNLTNSSKSSLNLNDDVFFDKTNKLVVSIDTYIEGSHFVNFNKPELVIKKVVRSSISDLICKGVKPRYYFISGSGNNKTFSMNNLAIINKSLKEEQKKYNPVIGSLQRVSRPGLRVYVNSGNIPRVLDGLGISILSTSKGVISNKTAQKLNVGGEILCEVY